MNDNELIELAEELNSIAKRLIELKYHPAIFPSDLRRGQLQIAVQEIIKVKVHVIWTPSQED